MELEKVISVETQLAVISYNEVLCELFNYFDRMKIGGKFEDKDLDDDNGNKVYDGALKFSDLQSPESPESAEKSLQYTIPRGGRWKKDGKEGTLLLNFNCHNRGTNYGLQIELHDCQNYNDINNLLKERNFLVNGLDISYSPRKTVIEVALYI